MVAQKTGQHQTGRSNFHHRHYIGSLPVAGMILPGKTVLAHSLGHRAYCSKAEGMHMLQSVTLVPADHRPRQGSGTEITISLTVQVDTGEFPHSAA